MKFVLCIIRISLEYYSGFYQVLKLPVVSMNMIIQISGYI